MLINQIINVEEDFGSGDITEPVTLQQAKNYLRLEGSPVDSEGIAAQEPISLTLLEGETTVTAPAGKAILALTREGTGFSKSDTLGNRRFTYNLETGVIAFVAPGSAGGETIDILYGNITGNVGDDAFNFDDTLIESMITEARMWVEKYTGQYLVPRTLVVVLLNQAGYIELPGPVDGDIALVNCEDVAITDAVFVGNKLQSKYGGNVTATYNVGYISDYPKWVENSIWLMWHGLTKTGVMNRLEVQTEQPQ